LIIHQLLGGAGVCKNWDFEAVEKIKINPKSPTKSKEWHGY
jgi:preprotein translocase subunit Sec61beta